MHKITIYLLPLLMVICSSLLGQNCKSLTWHTPNPYSEEMTEANPKKLQEDSLQVLINYDCETVLSPKDFTIWVDDIPEPNQRANIKRIAGRTFSTTVYISQGKHKVEIRTAKSQTAFIWLSYAGKPDLYVFSVGVPHPDLEYTTTDAKDIANAFKQLEGRNIFGNVFTALHISKDSTSKSDITGGLRKMYAQSKHKYIRRWDFVVIYMASHGFMYNGTFYFQCKGFQDDPLLYKDFAISSDELLELLNAIPCKKLLLIDACYSGGLKTETLAARGEDYEYKKALQKLSDKVTALSILTATDKEQTAAESDKWQNGAFTEALIEALVQGKCDKNQDAILDLKEISEYVKMRVPTLVKEIDPHKIQTPTLVQDSLGGDMPIFATRILQDYDKIAEKQEVEYYLQIAKDAYKIENYSLAFELLYKYKDSSYFGAEEQFDLGYCYEIKQDYEKAFKWYLKAAEKGYVYAQYNLGHCYRTGEGVKQDYEKAFEWYQKAANQGFADAQNNLGSCYLEGIGIKQDYEKAIEWYIKAANQGSATGQFNLGICYDNGQGVKQDYEKAFEWYLKAANQELAMAQCNVGSCYYTKQDFSEAFKWCEKSANQGNAKAQSNLGICYRKGQGVKQDYEKAFEWFQKAANQGLAIAQYYLGNSYYNGEGVKQDYYKAFEWYQKAANQGFVNAQYNLGDCYYNGQGTKQDYEKAFEWYQKAANQEDAQAQINLGVLYEEGKGVKQNYYKAFEWYQKAANQEDAMAQCEVGHCYYDGQGIKQDYEKAFEWYQKAANQGFVNAQYNLGGCYYNGQGTKQDYEKAFEWYQKAAEKGYVYAQFNLGACYYNGQGIKQDKEKAIEWLQKAARQGHEGAQAGLKERGKTW